MQVETIISLVVAGVILLGGIIALVIAIVRGDMKKFIVEKMEEAEKLELSGEQKLKYVIQAVNEKYKILRLILNIKKYIEYIISISKEINAKKITGGK